jgi:putative transposase
MPRPVRLNMEGGTYHILQRGNKRQNVFGIPRDYEAFLERVGRCVRLFDCRLHAYCLMPNHVHLLLETRQPNLSAFGQRLFSSYTLWYNRKHESVGHLFQGRFKSLLVDSESYLAELSRYIHLNPTRGGLAAKPETYRWSSLRAYLRSGDGEPWVHTQAVLERFEGSRKAYLDYVFAGVGKSWKPPIWDRLFLGTEAFVKRVKKRMGWLDGSEARRATSSKDVKEVQAGILRTVAKQYGLSREALMCSSAKRNIASEARQIAIAILRQKTPMTLRQIGELMGGVKAAAVANTVTRVRKTPSLQIRADQIAREIE